MFFQLKAANGNHRIVNLSPSCTVVHVVGGITAMTTFFFLLLLLVVMEALLFSGVNGSLAFPIKRFVAAVALDDLD